MPTVSSRDGTALENEPSQAGAGSASESMIVPKNGGSSSDIAQILPSLITLAMLPKSQWQALVNLDIIKVLYSTSCWVVQFFWFVFFVYFHFSRFPSDVFVVAIPPLWFLFFGKGERAIKVL